MHDGADIKIVYWIRPVLLVEEYRTLSLFVLLRL